MASEASGDMGSLSLVVGGLEVVHAWEVRGVDLDVASLWRSGTATTSGAECNMQSKFSSAATG